MALGFRERPQERPLQVLVDLVVQLDFCVAGCEGYGQRHTCGEANVLIRVFSQRPLRQECHALGEVIVPDASGVVQVAFLERIK